MNCSTITISRALMNNNSEDASIHLVVKDGKFDRVITVKLSLDDFAKAVTGQAYVPVQYDWRSQDED